MRHSTAKPGENGQIRNQADLEANTATPAHVFGTYVWVDPRQEAPPGVEMEHKNLQAAVRLEDGVLIYLQVTWKPEAIRPEDELTTYQDKAVVVTGMVLRECPSPPDGRAYLKGACMDGPISITDRGTWDALHGGKIEW